MAKILEDLPTPNQSRQESYLGVIAGQEGAIMPEKPLSREEEYLEYIAEHGGGGGEPSAYLKSISKDETSKIVTVKDKQGNETEIESAEKKMGLADAKVFDVPEREAPKGITEQFFNGFIYNNIISTFFAYGHSTNGIVINDVGMSDYWQKISVTHERDIEIEALGYNDDYILAIDGSGVVYRTNNNRSAIWSDWEELSQLLTIENSSHSIAYNDGLFMLLKDGEHHSTVACVSLDDGITWNEYTVGEIESRSDIKFLNGYFCFVDNNNRSVYYSLDGETWLSNTITSDSHYQYNQIEFNDGLYHAIGCTDGAIVIAQSDTLDGEFFVSETIPVDNTSIFNLGEATIVDGKLAVPYLNYIYYIGEAGPYTEEQTGKINVRKALKRNEGSYDEMYVISGNSQVTMKNGLFLQKDGHIISQEGTNITEEVKELVKQDIPVKSVNEKTGDIVLSASDIKAADTQTVQENLERIDEDVANVVTNKQDKISKFNTTTNPAGSAFECYEIGSSQLSDGTNTIIPSVGYYQRIGNKVDIYLGSKNISSGITIAANGFLRLALQNRPIPERMVPLGFPSIANGVGVWTSEKLGGTVEYYTNTDTNRTSYIRLYNPSSSAVTLSNSTFSLHLTYLLTGSIWTDNYNADGSPKA